MKKEFVDKLEKAPEYQYYIFIELTNGFLSKMRESILKGEVDGKKSDVTSSIKEIAGIQKHTVTNLTKWGVDPNSVGDKNGSYWKWFNFWANWHKSLPEGDWNIVNDKIGKDEDISEYLPKGKWNDE